MCNRYGVNNKGRKLHNAIIDCKILSQVYLRMTGGQGNLVTNKTPELNKKVRNIHSIENISGKIPTMNIERQDGEIHTKYLQIINKAL